MRVISGTAKGHTLKIPEGPVIRPTLDIVRKAVFDILQTEIKGARFLDLFAGTGANGIEALSRGALSAVFVDKSGFCIRTIKENLIKTHLMEYADIYRGDAFKYIESQYKKVESGSLLFDIVFADPPYDAKRLNRKSMRLGTKSAQNYNSPAEMALHALSAGNILSINTIVIIEHSADVQMPASKGILAIWKTRYYGSTQISIYRKKGGEMDKK